MDSGWDQGPFEQTGPPENPPQAEMMVSWTKNTGMIWISDISSIQSKVYKNTD